MKSATIDSYQVGMRIMKREVKFFLACFIILITVGCGKTQEKQETLTICTGSAQEYSVRMLAEAWTKMNAGPEIEVISIPSDDTLAETKITQLRTEIMSDNGPDVFIMPCNIATENRNSSVLFSDPEKIMHSGIFLPLDAYIKKASYVDSNGWNQTIMEAGKTEEGQVILPIAYTYCAYAFPTDESIAIPNSWEEMIHNQDFMIGANIPQRGYEWLSPSFGKLADYEEETLLFSEEDLQKRIEEVFEWQEKNSISQNITETSMIAWGNVTDEFWKKISATGNDKKTVVAFPNDENGVTAYITLYAAVNRNTEYPEQAFSFLDFVFSDEIMTGVGFPSEDPEIQYGATWIFSEEARKGMLVNKSAIQQILKNQTTIDVFNSIENRINDVRYYSSLDNELYWLYDDCAYGKNHEALPSAADRREFVSKAYERMEMQLAE